MGKSVQLKLRIDDLHKRHPGLTANLGGTYTEAACVCMNRHHASPVEMHISCDERKSDRLLDFESPDRTTLRAWNNEIDTTEIGAYGISLAVVEIEERLVAVMRAETQTGADWYVSPIGSEPEDLEGCYRLEVSGVNAGTSADVQTRLKSKMEQTRRGASNLPAIASVVGFKECSVLIRKVRGRK